MEKNKTPLAEKKIFIIEDEEFLSNVLKIRLEAAGASLEIAHNGKKALEILEHEKFDLLLLDVIMPEMNGFEFLQELRAQPKHKKTKVILLSNLAQANDKVEGKKYGVLDYLIKSNTPLEEIVSVISKHITK